MRRRYGDAQTCAAPRDSWIADRRNEKTFFSKRMCEIECLLLVSDNQRKNRASRRLIGRKQLV